MIDYRLDIPVVTYCIDMDVTDKDNAMIFAYLFAGYMQRRDFYFCSFIRSVSKPY
jgi:hypothetical protein